MPHVLGIDLGSGTTTAAICRTDRDGWTAPAVLPLEPSSGGTPDSSHVDHVHRADRATVPPMSVVLPAVLHLTDDDTVEVGEQAARRAAHRPYWIARELVDRVGDEVPLAIGDRQYPAEVLAAAVIGWVVDRAETIEGMPATQLVVTHPADWGAHRKEALRHALREAEVAADMSTVTLLPRPIAAAEQHAARERVEVGEQMAVHSLGAGRFEAAVLRRGSFGFELRSHAASVDVLGGALFDDLLAEHVRDELGIPADGAEHAEHAATMAWLRDTCVNAKELLSTQRAVTIPPPPDATTNRTTTRGATVIERTAFDDLIRPAVDTTVLILRRTIRAAGTEPGELRATTLVGGCAAIPLVGELVSADLRIRVAAAPEPDTAVAAGAALAGTRMAKPTLPGAPMAVAPTRSVVTTSTDLLRRDTSSDQDDAGMPVSNGYDAADAADMADADIDVGPPPPRPPVEITALEPPRRRLLRRRTPVSATTRDTAERDGDRDPADSEVDSEVDSEIDSDSDRAVGGALDIAIDREHDRDRHRDLGRNHDRILGKNLGEDRPRGRARSHHRAADRDDRDEDDR